MKFLRHFVLFVVLPLLLTSNRAHGNEAYSSACDHNFLKTNQKKTLLLTSIDDHSPKDIVEEGFFYDEESETDFDGCFALGYDIIGKCSSIATANTVSYGTPSLPTIRLFILFCSLKLDC